MAKGGRIAPGISGTPGRCAVSVTTPVGWAVGCDEEPWEGWWTNPDPARAGWHIWVCDRHRDLFNGLRHCPRGKVALVRALYELRAWRVLTDREYKLFLRRVDRMFA